MSNHTCSTASPPIVLVTGATGNVGARVTDGLVRAGVPTRVFARDEAKARARLGGEVEIAAGDFADAGSLGEAMRGVEAVLLVTSGPDLAELDRRAAEIASRRGVGLLVKISSFDAEEQIGTGAWHARGEAAIAASGVPFTFVRPAGFMSNTLFWARSINADGVVRASTGDGRIAFVDPDDIADVAIAALTSRRYAGAKLPITGPAALSYGEMTAAIGAAIGREIRFEAISDDAARARSAATGVSAAETEAHVAIWRAVREGRLAAVTGNVERVLGRSARTFDAWLDRNRAAFG